MNERRRINSRIKGHGFEREVAERMRAIFPDCVTSRFGDRSMDSRGVDLLNTGLFAIQCKATEKAPGLHEVLKAIRGRPGDIPAVLWKRNRKGTVVVLEFDDFMDLLQLMCNENIL